MHITLLRISNYRCFANAEIRPSKSVNVVVGQNNSGKSTLLSPISALQFGVGGGVEDRRMPDAGYEIFMGLDGSPISPFGIASESNAMLIRDGTLLAMQQGNKMGVNNPPFSASYPNNFACVFLAKRKVGGYSETAITTSHANNVIRNLESLPAKLVWILTEGNPQRDRFLSISEQILGIKVSASASANGLTAVYVVDMERQIPIANMGDGVGQVLALVYDLLRAEEKVFVIEELENDLHPRAIRELLNLLIESARERGNQFFISTHSNVVVRHLASEQETRVFRTNLRLENRVPLSEVELVPNTPEARRELLEELGYELSDAGLFSGYLILEESSAETIVTQLLIPWFFPKLAGKLRTIAGGGFEDAKVRLVDLGRLFTYLHLEPTYRDRAWIVLDAGEKEMEVITQLKRAFSGDGKWPENSFRQWPHHDFERFYPARFGSDVDRALSINSDNKQRDSEKKKLRIQVVDWAKLNPQDAKEEFKSSAKEVIDFLREIDEKLCD